MIIYEWECSESDGTEDNVEKANIVKILTTHFRNLSLLQPVSRLSKRALTEGEQIKKSANEKLTEGTGIIFTFPWLLSA